MRVAILIVLMALSRCNCNSCNAIALKLDVACALSTECTASQTACKLVAVLVTADSAFFLNHCMPWMHLLAIRLSILIVSLSDVI